MEWLVFELEEMKRHLASGINAEVQYDVRENTSSLFIPRVAPLFPALFLQRSESPDSAGINCHTDANPCLPCGTA